MKPTRCAECSRAFQPKRDHATFCSTACRTAYHNRNAAHGKTIVPMLQAWRMARGSGPTAKEAFKEACRLLDAWNADDKANGRARAEDMVARQFAGALNAHFRA